MELAASFVCSVENTRWPVSAAWTAFSAVSRSRISPTMMMSGSWRRIVRSVLAEGDADLRLHATWLKLSWTISMGSSMVTTFTSGVATVLSAE